jgi:CRP-like cAMP-binding protein
MPVVEQTIPARRVIFRQRDLHDLVPFICRGWAACAVTLSDGSRQILSFLLPGDIVSSSLLFGSTAHCMVEAITEVQYRSFRRDDLRTMLLTDPDLLGKIARLWMDGKQRAYELAVDLGRRTADERIARATASQAVGWRKARPWIFRCASITSRTRRASPPSMSARCSPSFDAMDSSKSAIAH